MSCKMLKTNVNPRIQEILQTTVKLLCQNSIDFGVQLSIQGLIGITVDGSEVLLVNIAEHVDKTSDDNTTVSTTSPAERSNNLNVRKRFKSERAKTAWSVPIRDIKDESPLDDDCVVLTNDIKRNTENPLGGKFENNDVVYTTEEFIELNDSENNYAETEEDYSAYDENVEQDYNETDCFDDADQYYDTTTTDVSEKSQAQRSSFKFMRNDASKRRITHARFRQKQRLAAAAENAAYNDNIGGDDRTIYTDSNDAVGGSVGRQKTSVLPSECHQVFTCSICGQSVRHLRSFIRHKKQHDGTALYRCENCGKAMNRRDNLVTHMKRHCPLLNGAGSGGSVQT